MYMYGYSYSATVCQAEECNRLAADKASCFASHKPVDYTSISRRAARRGRHCTPTGKEKRETGLCGNVRISISSRRLRCKVAKCYFLSKQ